MRCEPRASAAGFLASRCTDAVWDRCRDRTAPARHHRRRGAPESCSPRPLNSQSVRVVRLDRNRPRCGRIVYNGRGAARLCRRCGKNPPQPDRKACQPRAHVQRDRAAALRTRRLARGLCVQCGGPAGGQTRCPKCLRPYRPEVERWRNPARLRDHGRALLRRLPPHRWPPSASPDRRSAPCGTVAEDALERASVALALRLDVGLKRPTKLTLYVDRSTLSRE